MMERRESMPMSGSASYHIMYRGLTPTHPSSGWQSGPSPDVRPLSTSNPTLPLQSPNVGSGSAASTFQGESPSPETQHGAGANTGGAGCSTQGEPFKKKRGRPRKYGPDGTVALGLSPVSPGTSGPGFGVGAGSLTIFSSSTPKQKQGKGRRPGTGKKQLASYGEWVSSSAGTGFTPHIITISIGEDIASKLMSFSQLGPRAICIMSASGAVSTVTLRQPVTSGGTVTYEGRLEILSLSGFYFLADDGGSCSRSGSLSVSLCSPDGRIVGGVIAGQLTAASQVQVIVGSFRYGGGKKAKGKSKPESEPEAEPNIPLGEKQVIPNSQPNHGASPVFSGWPGSRQPDTRNSHLEIDLTRG